LRRIKLRLSEDDLITWSDVDQGIPVAANRAAEKDAVVIDRRFSRRNRPRHTALSASPHMHLHRDGRNFSMRKVQYLDLQAPMPSDQHCRRRAFLLIALLYGLAGLANFIYWCRS
jgi:hypothetical protein